MKSRAKSSSTPHPVWIYGSYTNKPPLHPYDGVAYPEGHYIDKGGYPGANVYRIDINTLCIYTGITDREGKEVYTQDILLYEPGEEISYLLVYGTAQAVDIISGEIIETKYIGIGNIKVTGNLVDNPGFVDGISYVVDNNLDMPYLPELDVVSTPLPYLKLTCLKCGHVTLSSRYMAFHKNCGGYYMAGYATEIHRKKKRTPA